MPANFLSRVQLGGRALPRRGRGGWFDSIHAHVNCDNAMPPFHGWDAALRTLTARVQVLPAVPHQLCRQHGLRSGTSLVSKTGRAGFDPSAACQRVPSEAPRFRCPLGSAAERRPHTPEVTVRLGQGVPDGSCSGGWNWNTPRSQKSGPERACGFESRPEYYGAQTAA